MDSYWKHFPTHLQLEVTPPSSRFEAQVLARKLSQEQPSPPDVTLEQVHSATCREAIQPDSLTACDAVWTRRSDLTLAIRTADCLPVIFFSPEPQIALAHAGWRGLISGVLENTLATFSSPSSVSVWIGPGIGPCCFEVGPEVSKEFPLQHHRHPTRARPFIDLPGAAQERLQNLGVKHVVQSNLCTRCSQHLLYSYRGSGGGKGRLETRARIRGA